MKHYWLDDMDGLIIEGDILAALSHLEDESVEAVVTDPPYELNFMGKSWDDSGVSFQQVTWEACLRVLKSGGHLVVFGGTRTHHRMWVAIEDAGFEVRDMLLWMYGQGFPKSLNVSKAVDSHIRTGKSNSTRTGSGTARDRRGQHWSEFPKSKSTNKTIEFVPTTTEAQQWDGWGTAFKPACEPILLARKPLSEKTVAANVLKHSTGALNIDATRLEYQSESDKASATPQGQATSKSSGALGMTPDAGRNLKRVSYNHVQPSGRWPANVMLQCTCDDPQPVPEKARKRNGEEAQERRYDKEGSTNVAAEPGTRREGGGFVHEPDRPAGMLDAQSGTLKSGMMKPGQQRRKSKGKGGYHDNMPDEATAGGTYGDVGGASRFFYCPKATKKERGEDNTHPTVKPLALMRWLVRLVTPPNGVVLDPFCGSGSTLIAATEEGFGFIGVDVSPEYCQLAQQRLKGRNT